uniref:Uncharacterized protein n=1 Tax=Myotis myotis TaxID=51298 RepID=A0A7J7Z5L5_MYOMY|nr:hypothetical protein mMyoMyo1_010607 [Myotis myotis]
MSQNTLRQRFQSKWFVWREKRGGEGRGGEGRETFGKHCTFLELNPRALCSSVYTTCLNDPTPGAKKLGYLYINPISHWVRAAPGGINYLHSTLPCVEWVQERSRQRGKHWPLEVAKRHGNGQAP